MKKILFLALVLCMVLALGVSCFADDHVTLVYAEVNPIEGTTVGAIATYFKEKVEELTDGTVAVDIQANAVHGSENDVLYNMINGSEAVDIARISAFAPSSYGCDKTTLLSMPYTFADRDHFWTFAGSKLAEEFLNEPRELGLPFRGIFYGEEGFRHFFTSSDFEDIEDLRGKKIRVSRDPVMVGMVQGLGASATVVAFAELYSALRTGVVDGSEMPLSNYYSVNFFEVADNLILDGHTVGAIEMVIADSAVAKLTDSQYAAVCAAAKLTMTYNRQIVQQKDDEILNLLKAKGCNIVAVEDKTPWREACSEIIGSYICGYEDLYQQILDMGAGSDPYQNILRLPQELEEIGEAAFASVDAREVILYTNTVSIGSRAFADSALETIFIPDSVNSIAADAFSGCEGLSFLVQSDTGCAAQYAAAKGIPFTVVESIP